MKKAIIFVVLALIGSIALSAQIKTATIAESATTGTWSNTASPKKTLKLQSAFGTLAGVAADADTITASVSNGDVTYTVDTGTITSNLTTLVIDFADDVYVGYGETVTFTRLATTTNEILNIMLVME